MTRLVFPFFWGVFNCQALFGDSLAIERDLALSQKEDLRIFKGIS